MRITISHFELPASDPERLAAFYREAFDWRTEAVARPGKPPYLKVRTPAPERPAASAVRGAIQGGLASREELGTDQPLLVLHVEDEPLEVVLERIRRAGGTVDGGIQGESAGRFARFQDPEGNRLGLWEA